MSTQSRDVRVSLSNLLFVVPAERPLATQANEFLERALACRTCYELVALGAEYVAFEEEAPRES